MLFRNDIAAVWIEATLDPLINSSPQVWQRNITRARERAIATRHPGQRANGEQTQQSRVELPHLRCYRARRRPNKIKIDFFQHCNLSVMIWFWSACSTYYSAWRAPRL